MTKKEYNKFKANVHLLDIDEFCEIFKRSRNETTPEMFEAFRKKVIEGSYEDFLADFKAPNMTQNITFSTKGSNKSNRQEVVFESDEDGSAKNKLLSLLNSERVLHNFLPKEKSLQIRNKLVQISVTDKEVNELCDWVDSDVALKGELIPHVFEEGYILYFGLGDGWVNVDRIKNAARLHGTTFNETKRYLEQLEQSLNPTWIYFKWVREDLCEMMIYTSDLFFVTKLTATDKSVDASRYDDARWVAEERSAIPIDKDFLEFMCLKVSNALSTVFKYLNNREKNQTPTYVLSKKKYKEDIQERKPKKVHNTLTPTIDLRGRRDIKVSSLTKQRAEMIRRTASWDVRGHQRVCKSGKIVWVKAFVKGKERENHVGTEYDIDFGN